MTKRVKIEMTDESEMTDVILSVAIRSAPKAGVMDDDDEDSVYVPDSVVFRNADGEIVWARLHQPLPDNAAAIGMSEVTHVMYPANTKFVVHIEISDYDGDEGVDIKTLSEMLGRCEKIFAIVDFDARQVQLLDLAKDMEQLWYRTNFTTLATWTRSCVYESGADSKEESDDSEEDDSEEEESEEEESEASEEESEEESEDESEQESDEESEEEEDSDDDAESANGNARTSVEFPPLETPVVEIPTMHVPIKETENRGPSATQETQHGDFVVVAA